MTVLLGTRELDQLRALVERRMGLVFHPHQLPMLIDAAQDTARHFRYADAQQLQNALSGLPLGAPEMDYLISRITVGESFFFRDGPQMDFLRREFLPTLIRRLRRQGKRTLRVWSAAAAAGQELYSVAMLLRELLPDVDEWNLHLLGTDINAESLRAAVEGSFSEWSMRAVDASQRDRHFLPHGGGGARVRPELQRMARFSILNLAGEDFPSMLADLHSFDLILCRNVFIYFDQQRVHAILSRIVRCLAPSGVLMLGASDVVAVNIEGLETLQRDGMCYYHLLDRSGASDLAPLVEMPASAAGRGPRGAEQASEARRLADARSDMAAQISGLADKHCWQDVVSMAERAALRGLRDDAPTCRHIAAAFGNLGRHEEALDWCEQGLVHDPTSAEAHFLHALLQVEAGKDGAALEAFRRTLFLAPGMLEAHHQLGLLQLRVGNRDKGLRSLRNALQLARRQAQEGTGEKRSDAARMLAVVENDLVIHDQEEKPRQP